MKDEKINVLFICDDNFFLSFMTTIYSLFKNNQNESFNIYFMGDLSENNLSQLNNFVKRHNSILITVKFDDCKYREILDSSNYYYIGVRRLFAPFLIKTDKLLYLDSDIIIQSSIKELYNLDFNNQSLFAVKDINDNGFDTLKKDFSINTYYNSGIILFNSKKIRDTLSYEVILETIREHHNNLKYFDQDLMNILFKNSILELNQSYNYQIFKKTNVDVKTLKKQNIIHFLWTKPWSEKYGFFNKKASIFWKYGKKIFTNKLFFTIKIKQIIYDIKCLNESIKAFVVKVTKLNKKIKQK